MALNAIDWAIANRAKYGIRIINLSLGHPVFEPAADDPLCEAVERAVASGMVVVAAAGNLGKTPDGTPVVGGIESPGNSPYAITVGALNTKQTAQRSDDVVATYSSRGPTLFDYTLKPDLVAPGILVRSSYPGGYATLSGTSMAAPHVAGAAALLWSAFPALRGDVTLTESILEQSAVHLTTLQGCGGDSSSAVPNNVYGYGLIDVLAAYNLYLEPTPVPGYQFFMPWLHN